MAGDELRLRQATAQGLGVDDSGTGTGSVDGATARSWWSTTTARRRWSARSRPTVTGGRRVRQAALDARLAERSYELSSSISAIAR
jgi:hypothetical protein